MTAPQPIHSSRPSMAEVHARGGHKKVPSQKCPDCKAERDARRDQGLAMLNQRETAVKRLHSHSCSVSIWEAVGRHHCRPRPVCNCGAENHS